MRLYRSAVLHIQRPKLLVHAVQLCKVKLSERVSYSCAQSNDYTQSNFRLFK